MPPPRRPKSAGSALLASIRHVLFDLDGTLTVPTLDFEGIRARLGLAPGVSIVHALQQLAPHERAAKQAVLQEIELEAARKARPSPGALELVGALGHREIGMAVITRNFALAVRVTLETLSLHIPVVITRDDAAPKPAPDGLLLAMRQLNASPAQTLMVGDFRDDMQAGKAAGAWTCLVMHGNGPKFEADLHVDTPQELLHRFQQAWQGK